MRFGTHPSITNENVLTIFTNKKMMKHACTWKGEVFVWLSLVVCSIDVKDFFYVASESERESEKDSRIIYPLSDTTPSHHLAHSRYAHKIRRKRKHWGRTMIMLISFFFNFYYPLSLSSFNATNAAVIKEKPRKLKIEKAVKEIKQI
mgnify:CR=1 FL=1